MSEEVNIILDSWDFFLCLFQDFVHFLLELFPLLQFLQYFFLLRLLALFFFMFLLLQFLLLLPLMFLH